MHPCWRGTPAFTADSSDATAHRHLDRSWPAFLQAKGLMGQCFDAGVNFFDNVREQTRTMRARQEASDTVLE